MLALKWANPKYQELSNMRVEGLHSAMIFMKVIDKYMQSFGQIKKFKFKIQRFIETHIHMQKNDTSNFCANLKKVTLH